MQRTVLAALCLLALGCRSERTLTTDSPTQTADAKVNLSSPGVNQPADDADAKREDSPASGPTPQGPVALKFAAGDSKSKLAPRYSPPGKALKLEAFTAPAELGFDGLQSEVLLGAPLEKQSPVKLLVTRATAEEVYSKLYIDADRNGVFDEPAIVAKMSNSRGMTWSSFDAMIKVTYQGEETVAEDYPVAFWLTAAAPADRPEVLRMSRRGYKVGEATVGSDKVSVVLSDSNNDAVFGEGDWWELRTEDSTSKPDMRRVGEFAWLGESAFKLEIENAFGSSARLVPFDPGITREADALARDPYGADRAAVKAAKPLEFRHDADAALTEATDKKIPCFIKFETTWCGPCKMMTQNVFTAKDVVDAAEGVMCIMVDGDERKDLVARYQVKAYPTGLMILADGHEANRFVGYQRVTQMAAFLKKREKN